MNDRKPRMDLIVDPDNYQSLLRPMKHNIHKDRFAPHLMNQQVLAGLVRLVDFEHMLRVI